MDDEKKNSEDEAQKLADYISYDTKIGSSSPAPSIPGDDKQFEDIVRAVEILVGDKNNRHTSTQKDMGEAGKVMQAVEDNITVNNEAWAVDQILQDEETASPQMSVLEVLIRDALPDLLQDWIDKNMEPIATELIKRDALHDAVAQVWSKKMKNSS